MLNEHLARPVPDQGAGRGSTVAAAPARLAAGAGGLVLAAVTRLAAARPAAKPLHPRGAVVRGTLQRFGAAGATGVPWLDQPGSDEVLVRRSRALGLPDGVPDVLGLAVRVPTPDGGHGDLLFATTGLGPVTRFTLLPARTSRPTAFTTLLPYRTPAGPVLLGAQPRGPNGFSLSWAAGAGVWHGFAELRLHEESVGEPDALVSFDPVTCPVPGLESYGWVRRLREPAYRTARRSRARRR